MTNIASNQAIKHQHYEHRTTKLDNKNSKFTHRKFQRIRKSGSHKKILASFLGIGTPLNDRKMSAIENEKLEKVCFILMNSYRDRKHDLGVGPLNDGYLVGLKHYRLGYKVFYLYDPRREEFLKYFGFFLKNTSQALTIFYTGRDTIVTGIHGIEFKDGTLSKDSICDIISENCNDKVNVMLASDCCSGGTVFDIYSNIQKFQSSRLNIISFFVDKKVGPESKEGRETQGLFSYYFCKYVSTCPTITPRNLLEKINPSLKRFKEVCSCQATKQLIAETQIFSY